MSAALGLGEATRVGAEGGVTMGSTSPALAWAAAAHNHTTQNTHPSSQVRTSLPALAAWLLPSSYRLQACPCAAL